jgi:hypothetical protein
MASRSNLEGGKYSKAKLEVKNVALTPHISKLISFLFILGVGFWLIGMRCKHSHWPANHEYETR